ncbi:MAG: DUF1360 domain-containing protein [Anaerolineae bacterium]|nr:DUF1360 domain-containing protein [Anaerolineae bacterium]
MPAAENKQAIAEQHLTYMAITGVFWTIFAVFNLLRKGKTLHLKPFDFVLLAFSALRMGRLIAYDLVTQPYRAPFTETVPDSYGASEIVVPKQSGWRRAVGELVSCPICSGTWAAAALVYALQIAPGPTRIFIAIMGAIGAGEILNALTESLSWGGESSRKQAGHRTEA